MKTIYLSPHFDDAALSCGGLIWEQIQAGRAVEVWTICAGTPRADVQPSDFAAEMHARWQLSPEEVVASRKIEDSAAMEVLGVQARYFDLLDAIYRQQLRTDEYLYTSDEELFGGIHPGDRDNFRQLAIRLANALPDGEICLVAPLTVGNHVDHQLVRVAAEQLSVPISYYPDYPYTRTYHGSIPNLVPEGWERREISISEEGLAAWQDSAGAYISQISTFWKDEADMRKQIEIHSETFNGMTLYEYPYTGR